MSLEKEPTLRNLDYQVSWFGLTFDDMPFLMVPTGVAMLAMFLFGLPAPAVVVVLASSVGGMVALKYGKPKDFLWLQLEQWFLPRHLSSKERDLQLDPTARLPVKKVSR